MKTKAIAILGSCPTWAKPIAGFVIAALFLVTSPIWCVILLGNSIFDLAKLFISGESSGYANPGYIHLPPPPPNRFEFRKDGDSPIVPQPKGAGLGRNTLE